MGRPAERESARGFTLVEVLISMSLLTVTCFFMFGVFQAASRYSTMVSDEALAVALAEAKMEEVKIWAYRKPDSLHHNFQGDWSVWSSTPQVVPDQERFRVAVEQMSRRIYSPSSTADDSADRCLAGSMRSVKVTVFFNYEGDVPQKSYSTVSLVGEPLRPVSGLTLAATAPIPSPLPRDGEVEFTAVALDANNDVIPDVSFRWTVVPLTGQGTITGTALNNTHAFFSNYKMFGPTKTYAGGTCKVIATCIGLDTSLASTISAESAAISLEP